MELIYSMRRKPLKCEPPQYESTSDPEITHPICTVSTANIIAFSSLTELADTDGDTWGGHVYVCDLDTPWDSHKVTSTTHPVSALEWDEEGNQLLVATTVGEVAVYGQKDYLLNDWTCLYNASFPGEHIIAAVFFHNGRRVELAEGKKVDAAISEKIKVLYSVPTLKGFGGCGLPGACVVSAGGTAGALAAGAQHCTRAIRDHLSAAALQPTHSGKIVVAAIAGSRVRCAALTVARGRVAAAPLPALCLPDEAQPTCVSWLSRESGETLLVAGSSVSVWRLAERPQPLHQRLCPVPGAAPAPGVKSVTECFNTLVWQQTGCWALPPSAGPARAVAWRRLSGAPVALSAGALHLADTQLVSVPVHCSSGPASPARAGSSPPKKAKYAGGALPSGGGDAGRAAACSVAVSRLAAVVVCVDSHAQLHVYKAATLGLPQSLTLLEYSLVTGYDCLDVLLATQQIELLHDRITESFQRQPAAFQQYYYQSWLGLRAAICRMSAGLATSASALAQHQSLLGAWAALGGDDSLLEDSAEDKQPDTAAAQPLRALLLRAVHCAATALQGVNTAAGYELVAEPAALALVRKLVSLSRGVTRAGDALHRPLARLAACRPPPQDLVEECLVAAAQTGAPRVWEALPRRGVAAPHGRPYPLYLEYGVEPEALYYNPEPPASQCDNTPTGPMDSIRYMYIGGGRGPAKWRQCARCGVRAFAAALAARHALQRAHDARYLPACRCGGKWTLHSNL